ncbi:uncharacterized protein LOC104901632 isoform X2 [Beta vulgaris subsp. vulgaris]|uniref:uncharacterized protein LOC104901632 isoform X2 n=1 Tax=Beta vulgaris subsp. vulgaris TaxID=3555 RepID=UPI00053F3568|nr:uncharacterized protein LOC104901632 isoform X2 [Beta vulgaris subsp. vulgaris]
MAEGDDFRRITKIWANSPKEEDNGKKLWGSIVLFSLIGATATTFALSRMQSGKRASGSFRSSFQEEARRRYRKRMQEEYEEELERVERIRRMQNVFNRERNKFKRSYESWRENGENGTGTYHQHFQREDWYWTAESSFRDRKTNYKQTPQYSGTYSLSRHYAVLGLDRSRTKPYTDDEIKSAFRAKALEFHPDQNQDNKDAAEAKFKEVLTSYEAIKSERKESK